MPLITRRLEFDAGHRVLGHGGKCKYLHGHRYAVELSINCQGLNELGMVIDFGAVKSIFGTWIDRNLDHNMILHPEDPLQHYQQVLMGRNPYLMPKEAPNPTAEHLAMLLHSVAVILFQKPLQVSMVRVYETPSCWADWNGPILPSLKAADVLASHANSPE